MKMCYMTILFICSLFKVDNEVYILSAE